MTKKTNVRGGGGGGGGSCIARMYATLYIIIIIIHNSDKNWLRVKCDTQLRQLLSLCSGGLGIA